MGRRSGWSFTQSRAIAFLAILWCRWWTGAAELSRTDATGCQSSTIFLFFRCGCCCYSGGWWVRHFPSPPPLLLLLCSTTTAQPASEPWIGLFIINLGFLIRFLTRGGESYIHLFSLSSFFLFLFLSPVLFSLLLFRLLSSLVLQSFISVRSVVYRACPPRTGSRCPSVYPRRTPPFER